jgi:hypothetical protein
MDHDAGDGKGVRVWRVGGGGRSARVRDGKSWVKGSSGNGVESGWAIVLF